MEFRYIGSENVRHLKLLQPQNKSEFNALTAGDGGGDKHDDCDYG